MKRILQNLVVMLASGLGLGFSPKAPGTLGSLWGVALFIALRDQNPVIWWSVGAVLIVTAILASEGAERLWQKKDDQRIVIDEVAGQWVAYSFVLGGDPDSFWLKLVFGFLFFRFFDIVKWFPARDAQNRIPGGLGVVADDLVAGAQAGMFLWMLKTILFWGLDTLARGCLNGLD